MRKVYLPLLIAAAPMAACAVSPYINKVYEYRPAPGQFVNLLPEYEPGDDHAAMIAKAEEALAGDKQPGAISLGAFGGYVVFGFDHTVMNTGGYDFKIYGNAIISDRDKNGGSCEPGIVWVSRDENGNGIPDDTWYQLAGSEYTNPDTAHNYIVTYTKPGKDHTPTPDPSNKHLTDLRYIPWTASDGTTGFIEANDYHTQPYWPEWLSEESMEFKGERLPDNAYDLSGDGSYYVLLMYPWGYADNEPNSTCPGFKIDWAVDESGAPVNLAGIDFVKVVTGIHQRCGWLGETSTEVCGAEDLHPDATSVDSIAAAAFRVSMEGNNLVVINNGMDMEAVLYDVSGRAVAQLRLTAGRSTHSLHAMPSGIYMLASPCGTVKIRL